MRSLAVVLLGVVLVGACSAADDGGCAGAPTPTDAAVTTTTVADLPTPTSTTIEIYPDAIVRELRRQAAEPRPVPRSAIPPRHLDVEAFPEILVPRDRIVYGGAPPDGIPSIDAPTFAATPEVELDDEPHMTASPADEVAESEEREQLALAILRLPARDRQLITLYLRGRSHAEIAAELDLSYEAARVALRRAIHRARRTQ